jgi:hypothetical protein
VNGDLKEQRSTPTLFLRLALGIGGCILVCSSIWVYQVLTHKLMGNCAPDSQAVLESQAHIEFPPSANHIDCGYIFMQGSEAWIRFEMSPSDLDTFLASTFVLSVDKTPIPDNVNFHYPTEYIREHLYGKGSGEEGRVSFTHYILIDITDPERYVVYVEAHMAK